MSNAINNDPGQAISGTTFNSRFVAVSGVHTGGGMGVQGQSITTNPVTEVSTTDASGFIAGQDPVFRQHTGVFGDSSQLGVFGNCAGANGTGVFGRGAADNTFAVRGEVTNGGAAVKGTSFGTGDAGFFVGTVEVDSGDVHIRETADSVGMDLLADLQDLQQLVSTFQPRPGPEGPDGDDGPPGPPGTVWHGGEPGPPRQGSAGSPWADRRTRKLQYARTAGQCGCVRTSWASRSPRTRWTAGTEQLI